MTDTPPPSPLPETHRHELRGGDRGVYRGGRRKVNPGTVDPYELLAKAKAKHEHYKSLMAELDYRKREGELLERKHVELLATRLHAFLAQSLRGLPDNLERQLGLSPDQVQAVQDYTDNLCLDIRERLHGF